MLNCKCTSVGKVFSDMLFNSIACFVQSSPFALPHFNKLVTFLLYIVSSQCIELSLLATTLNILFSERRTQLLTKTQAVKATHGFKHSVAMWKKPINTEAVNFLLSACCKEAFNFIFWFCSLEVRHDHILKAAGLVFSRNESIRIWIEIPTRINTDRHGLTHWVGVYVASVNLNNRFALVCEFSNKSFINKCFPCKNDRWTTNNVSSIFFRKVFISCREPIEFCITRFV